MGEARVRGVDRPDVRRVEGVVAAAAGDARRCAERGRRLAGRRRIRPVRVLRVRHRNAVLRPVGRRRAAVRELPHHRVVLADEGLPAHGPQPPFERHGSGGRARGRLPRLQLDHPEGERVPLRDPPRGRLRDVRGRQVAPHAGHRDGCGQPSRQVAARPWVRPVLRLHGRRDRPVPPRARVGQPADRAAPHARGGVPPHRGPRRPRHPLHVRPARRVTRPAVLPVVHARRVPRPAPGAGELHRSVPRPVRPRLGRVAGAGL